MELVFVSQVFVLVSGWVIVTPVTPGVDLAGIDGSSQSPAVLRDNRAAPVAIAQAGRYLALLADLVLRRVNTGESIELEACYLQFDATAPSSGQITVSLRERPLVRVRATQPDGKVASGAGISELHPGETFTLPTNARGQLAFFALGAQSEIRSALPELLLKVSRD